MGAVGLQIIATMNLKEIEIEKRVVGAAKYAALLAGSMQYERDMKTNIVEETFGIFYLDSLPPSVDPLVLKMNRCMVCQQRLERLDTFMSGGVAFCSSACRSSDAAGHAKVDPSVKAHESCPKIMGRRVPTISFKEHGSGSAGC